MFDEELSSFLNKFHHLRRAGFTAHLDVDTFAGKAWVGLRVMLGPVQQHQDSFNVKRRSPSYWRRQERRKAARAAEKPILESGFAADEANDSSNGNEDDSATEEVAEVQIIASSEKEDSTLCQLCDFKSKSEKGLEIHMSRKHGNIEQLDGNMSFEKSIEEKDASKCEFCDYRVHNKNVLERHIRYDHVEEDHEYVLKCKRERDPYYCRMCDRAMSSKSHFELHMKLPH